MNEELYSKITDALVDDGYAIIENALSHELIHTLYKLSLNDTTYKKAGISSSPKSHVDTSKRRDKIEWLDEDGASVSEYFLFCRGLQNYLNRSLYLGLTYYEAHFSLYEKGDFYEKHLDAFVGNKNRVVTTILYLNEEYKDEDEGKLVLYDKDDRVIKEVAPKGGTFVVFLSEKFPHEVLPTQTKRHSIAGWFRVDKR